MVPLIARVDVADGPSVAYIQPRGPRSSGMGIMPADNWAEAEARNDGAIPSERADTLGSAIHLSGLRLEAG